jgi:hypothetical protein
MITYDSGIHDERVSDRSRARDRSHESSAFVADAITRWLRLNDANIVRLHPQEILGGKTPIGIRVRIRIQAARTSVESSIDRLFLRESRDALLQGYTLALALPDLPRHRRAHEQLVAAMPPERPITWLFVGRYGQVEVVPPPREGHEAVEPESADQSSARSGTTA